jgi:hypothetical protein
MSSVVISGDTSGAITLSAPAVAGTNTITLPASTGTALVAPTALTVPNTTGTVMVSGNMPAFSAYQSTSQTIASATHTKVTIDTKEYDTNTNFNTTNYRFTPTVAGYYSFVLGIAAGNTGNGCVVELYKNGSIYKTAGSAINLTGFGNQTTGTAQAYANGTTDYFEFYAYQASGTSTTSFNSSASTYFQATLVRGA